MRLLTVTILSTIATIIAAGLIAGGVVAYVNWRHGGDEF